MRSLNPVSVDIRRYEEEEDNGNGGIGGIGGNSGNAIQSKCKESNDTLHTYWMSGSSKATTIDFSGFLKL